MSETTLGNAMATLGAKVLEGSDHPSLEELLAYESSESVDGASARLKEHLAWCSDCAQTVADSASWPEVDLRDPELERTAAEEAEDWQAIRQRIAATADIHDRDPVPAPVPFDLSAPAADSPPTPRPVYGPVYLLAAALLLAVVGLSIQVVRLSRQLEAPQANVFVVDLEPAGGAATRGQRDGRPGAGETKVPAGTATVVFLLVQDDLRPFDDHLVELRDESGGVLWRSGGLVRAPEGGFSIAIPLAVLPSSSAVIHLYGVGSEERELLATYRTRIERDAVD